MRRLSSLACFVLTQDGAETPQVTRGVRCDAFLPKLVSTNRLGQRSKCTSAGIMFWNKGRRAREMA